MTSIDTRARLDPALIDKARRRMGLPAAAGISQVVRAALQRAAGHPDATGVVRIGRPCKDRAQERE